MITNLVRENSKTSFCSLACIYGLVSLFFIANFYSWGLNGSFQSLFLAVLLLAPLFGFASFFLNAFLLQKVGKLLSGNGTLIQLSNVVAWSKSPYIVTLSMWAVLSFTQPDMVFIHYATSASAVSIILVSTLINIAAFVLLVRSIREIQGFSSVRAFFNALVAFALTCFVSLVIMFIGRYVYLLLI